MSDLFHENASFAVIARIFAMMALSRDHTYQILTKRPARMLELLSSPEFEGLVHAAYCGLVTFVDREAQKRHPMDFASLMEAPRQRRRLSAGGWSITPIFTLPLPNVWLGVSVEHQEAADERIPLLLKTPVAVRFISAEPLLGPIDLTRLADVPGAWRDVVRGEWRCAGEKTVREKDARKLDWVIAGGESGPGARPMFVAWPRALRDQCAAAGVPFFFKQWGDYPRGRPAGDGFVEAGWKPDHKGGAILDSLEWRQFPGQK